MREITDEQLMVMFKQGDNMAFDILFEKYRGRVYNFLYRMLGRDRESAEDLLQEIFVKVFRGKEFYEPKAKFSSWLFSIARNHCLNHIKSLRYIREEGRVSLDHLGRESSLVMDDILSVQSSQEKNTERKEMLEMLENAINILPEKYREIFLLHAVEGFSHEEISQTLKINPATVRTNYHRARIMLKEKIGPMLQEERNN